MPFEIIREPAFFRLVLIGRVTREEVMAMGLAVRQLEEAGGRVGNRLTDVSQVEISEITAEDIHSFARRRREALYPNKFRNAIYAPNPLQFGYARMFQTLA